MSRLDRASYGVLPSMDLVWEKDTLPIYSCQDRIDTIDLRVNVDLVVHRVTDHSQSHFDLFFLSSLTTRSPYGDLAERVTLILSFESISCQKALSRICDQVPRPTSISEILAISHLTTLACFRFLVTFSSKSRVLKYLKKKTSGENLCCFLVLTQPCHAYVYIHAR